VAVAVFVFAMCGARATFLLNLPPTTRFTFQTQIKLHVDLRYCTDKKPLIFEYEKKDSAMTVDKATILCQLRKTHAPMVFLDKAGTRPLPPADFLAMFQIVITTTHRFMNEWKKGSFQDELERDNTDDIPVYRYATDDFEQDKSKEACELLKVHWLRMVVDEGHSMGNDKTNSTIQFAAWVNAQRRWAMTGTPTKQNAAQIGQLRGLMRFLQHEFFTTRLEGDIVWKRNIAKCWRDGDLVAFFRLRSLLGFLMKRHTKLDIAELPPPVFHKTEVKMSYIEATTYNTLVCAVQANLLLTSMNGKTSGFQDSLLHRSQAKNARLALQNIRRVCTGWSRVVPTLSDLWYRETIYMAQKFKLSDDAIAEIRNFMYRAENEQLSECACCRISVSTLLLMPCCGGQSTFVRDSSVEEHQNESKQTNCCSILIYFCSLH
jgi:SNF2 family DNA or RNA helicase